MSGPLYSPAEMEAAEALADLSQERIFEMEAAALTLLDLNRLPISKTAENELKDFFKSLPISTIQKNSKKLIEYGIIPPFEVVDGGAEKRQRTPSLREQERLDDIEREKQRKAKLEQDRIEQQKKKDEEEKYRKSLEGKTAVDTFTGKKFEELDDILRTMDLCQPKMASVMMNRLFPPVAVEKWTKVMKKNCRDIYEPGAIIAQCNNVIDKVNLDTDICYICGTGFYNSVDDPRIAGFDLKVREGVRPTCEHILPIIQAIFFLDLFRPTEKGKLSAEKLDILKKEYSWAHECCNYVKADHSFLVTKIDKMTKMPSWDFNTNKTSKILSDILKIRGKFSGLEIVQQEIKKQQGKEKPWQETRIDYIRDNKMKVIVEHIKSKGNGGIVMIMGYGNCVDSTKINQEFLAVLDELKKNASSQPSSQETIQQEAEQVTGQGRRRRTIRSKKYRSRKYKKSKTQKNRRHK